MTSFLRRSWTFTKAQSRKVRIRSSYWALYGLLNDFESRCILAVAVVCAIAAGVPLPLIAVVFRSVIEEFPPSEDQVQTALRYMLAISSAYFALTWAWTVCWGIVGGRITRRLQESLVERIVGFDMAYFDTEPLDLTSILTADTQTIQRGTSEKVGLFIQAISYFVATFITGFILSPVLTGVLLAAIVPAILILVVAGSAIVSKYARQANRLSEMAAASAEQALRAVQVVQAFGAIEILCGKHTRLLQGASHFAFRKSISAAVMLGLVYFVCYAVNALAFYWGTQIGGSSGTIYAVVFLILDASFVINMVGPFLQTIAMASAAGSKVLGILQYQSPVIDPYAKDGKILQASDLEQDITLHNVRFVYPARPEKAVLQSISLNFKAGSSTGIVGHSGSGKSSLAGLFLRLYDPTSGNVKLGDIDLQSFNVASLRSHVALVDQQPCLFEGTILDNIRSGIVKSGEMTESEIRRKCQNALQDANAMDFVEQLPDGLDTVLTSSGALSGGQKQRICLARALVRRPAILIMDEPTSALDSTSEVKILDSIAQISKTGCTVIMIAHRLATVQNMDNIVVMEDGAVLEQGTHQELMQHAGAYKALVVAQQVQPGSSGSNSSTASSMTLCGIQAQGMLHVEEKEELPSQMPTRIPISGQAPGSVPGELLDSADLRRGSSAISAWDDASEGSNHQVSHRAHSVRQTSGWQLTMRVVRMSKPEWPLLIAGLMAAAVMGALIIYDSIVFGNLISILNHDRGMPDFQDRVNFFSLMFFIISLIAVSMSATSNSCFGLVSETLLTRIRDHALRNALSQDQAFFLDSEHSPHRLIAAINSDSNFVAGLSGNIIATIFSVCFNIISGLIVAIVFAWAIALVLLAVIPAIVLAGFFRVTLLTRFDKRHSESFKQAAALASEAVQNIRTVAAYGTERHVLQKYQMAIAKPYSQNFWFVVFGDLALTLSFCIVYFTYALAYWWGSRLVRNGQFSERDFFIMLPAFLLTAQQSGQLFTTAPELVQARSAARRLFALLDQKPTIIETPELHHSKAFLAREKDGTEPEPDAAVLQDQTSAVHDATGPASSNTQDDTLRKSTQCSEKAGAGLDGASNPCQSRSTPTSSPCPHGSLAQKDCPSPEIDTSGTKAPGGAGVVLEQVSLSYPGHSDKKVLKDVSLCITPGQSVGVVGPSGAGKSSLISLLERFFDPTAGRVLIDDKDIKEIPVGKHRARLSLVSQEPSLFEGSVAFNVGLGASPEGPRPSQDDIEATCRRIGMHDFIMSLPDGYATDCGAGGSKLSGGQRQRIAIARALIRNPELLILDEATSALDSHSERQVQEAIAAAGSGRTTITVAHRLSTVKDADIIFCFDKGKLVEQGSHDSLIAMGGVYASMVQAQTLG